jgi:hypothetical protein
MTNKSSSPADALTVESLTAAIHKHYCELEGKSGAIYDGPDGRAKTEAQGAKVISAIVKVGCQNEDEYHPADAINLCRNLANGYGCWLDTITRPSTRSISRLPASLIAFGTASMLPAAACLLLSSTSSRTNAILPTGNNFRPQRRYQHQRYFHHRARRTRRRALCASRTEPAFPCG